MSLSPDRIADSLAEARADAPPGEKSIHWDVFPDAYVETVRGPDHWDSYLRNALTFGFNDSLYFSPLVNALLAKHPPDGSLPTDVHPLIQLRETHGYAPLLPERLDAAENRGQIEKIREIFAKVVGLCGEEFLLANLAPPTGSPAVVELNFRIGGGPERTALVNYHDLYLVHYAWLIDHVAAKLFPGGPGRIVEIGAGYGGTAAKLKDLYPRARLILFDIPEVGAVQARYLAERFPEADIRLYADFKRMGAELFLDETADILVLPGWTIAEMPADSADLALNSRSMMEMTERTIADYFTALHRIVPAGGVFVCINRYVKQPGNIRIKGYPYDERWRILVSQTSQLQGHIHELVLQRTEEAQAFTVSDALASLPPF